MSNRANEIHDRGKTGVQSWRPLPDENEDEEMKYVEFYDVTKMYSAGDKVSHDGEVWICVGKGKSKRPIINQEPNKATPESEEKK